MKKIIYLLFIGLLGFSFLWTAEAQAGEKIRVEIQQIGEDFPFLKEDLQVPVIKGWSNQKAQQAVNARFLKDIRKFQQEMEKDAEEAYVDAQENGYFSGQYAAESRSKVLYNKDGLLGISIMYYQYLGGAHGMSYQDTFNIDLKTGKILTLKDIFQPGFNYKKLINREIRKQIAQEPERYFTGKYGFSTISDNQSFILKDNNLIIYFGIYEIGPYAIGIPEFKIPLAKLQKFMSERFVRK